MQWIKKYRLFLFDFDGLLVDTEELHFQAYIRMCAKRGYRLEWNFQAFSHAAHHTSSGLKDQIYADIPDLQAEEPDWKVLYEEKKKAFLEILEEGHVNLMSGVQELLTALNEDKIKCCVVTNSPLSVIHLIRRRHPLLDLIRYWITRENYSRSKPDPECYQYAIRTHSRPGDLVIGFEDSPKGFEALRRTNAVPVMICPLDTAYLKNFTDNSIKYYPSFDSITDLNFP